MTNTIIHDEPESARIAVGHLQTFRAFGALATLMDFTEVYTALQTGVLDGQENPAEIVLSNKLYEVQKYLSLTQRLFRAPPPLVRAC